MAVVRKDILEEVAGYIEFDVEDARLLLEIGPLVRDRFHPIVDRFYEAIQENEGASAAITGGAEQVERLKGTLRSWLEGVVGGVYDEAYLERRSRIGRVHVRIGLDQRYMLSAMNLLRDGLHHALDDALDKLETKESWTTARRRAGHSAIDKICDIELAIMLETYREDYVARIRRIERLATLGEFAASIGHELRNPLAVIETSIHLLRKRMGQDERAAKHIHRIAEQVTLCSTIIADLLEMARDRPPAREPTDVAALIRQAVEALPHRPTTVVELDLEDDLPPAHVDSLQVRQVVVNLVMNAVQAASSDGRADGHVWVRLRTNDEHLELRVEDDGPGIAPEAQERLFEALFSTRSKGFGLGLALCRRIAEKHGGSIEAANRSTGGACFSFQIPLVASSATGATA